MTITITVVNEKFSSVISTRHHNLTYVVPLKMDRNTKTREQLDALVLENISKWQLSKKPLAMLREEQLDVIYQVDDIIKSETETQETRIPKEGTLQIIDTYEEYIKLYVQLESDLKTVDLDKYTRYYNQVSEQAVHCQNLFFEVSSKIVIFIKK